MFKKTILLAVLFLAATQLWSQSKVNSRIPLLGEDAPAFTAETTNGTIQFPADYGRKWKILFSHPADFTPVCTTELMQLALMQKDFKDLNVALVVLSTDLLYKHEQWVKSMENILEKSGTPVKISFPLVDDSKFQVGWQYGMLTRSQESFKAVRGVYIIDPDNKIRMITFYPTNVGRNMQEIERTVIALQTSEANTVMTPADWQPGGDVLLPYPRTADYYDPSKVKDPGLYDLSWYVLFQKQGK